MTCRCHPSLASNWILQWLSKEEWEAYVEMIWCMWSQAIPRRHHISISKIVLRLHMALYCCSYCCWCCCCCCCFCHCLEIAQGSWGGAPLCHLSIPHTPWRSEIAVVAQSFHVSFWWLMLMMPLVAISSQSSAIAMVSICNFKAESIMKQMVQGYRLVSVSKLL